MLITKGVYLKMGARNLKHYLDLGYDAEMRQEVFIKTEHLTKGSHAVVEYNCDICGEKCHKVWKDYVKARSLHNFDTCSKCKMSKSELTNINRYGAKYHMMTDEGKLKIKEAVFNKYGVENIFELKETKEKIKKYNMENYGVDSYRKTKECKDKISKTNMKKYGFEFATKNKKVKEKTKNTNMEKYGVENVMELNEFVSKIQETNISKYGVKSYSMLEECKQKVKGTCLNKYGVENYSQTEEYKHRVKKTNLKRYGYEWALSSPIIRAKINKTLSKNGTTNTSSQQIQLYEMILEKYKTTKINFPYSKNILDIVLFVDDLKINIEYDGWYWHNKTRDRRRDEYLKSEGWKILRVKGGRKTPNSKDVFEKIDELLYTDKIFAKIVMKDWRDDIYESSSYNSN